jgi:DNA-binding response OmpR family regulator
MTMEARAPRLLVQGSGDQGREILLSDTSITIGRLQDSDVSLADRLVSRRHAVIQKERGQWMIRDAGSRNGTFVNGKRISDPHILRDGDEIQIGLDFKAVYVDPEATGALVTDALVHGTGLWVDEERREVWVQGSKISPSLSRAQFTLLKLLYGEPGRVFERDAIIEQVWPDAVNQGVSDETIDALVGRLRRRIASVDSGHSYIVTVRGHGFRLVQPWDE